MIEKYIEDPVLNDFDGKKVVNKMSDVKTPDKLLSNKYIEYQKNPKMFGNKKVVDADNLDNIKVP